MQHLFEKQLWGSSELLPCGVKQGGLLKDDSQTLLLCFHPVSYILISFPDFDSEDPPMARMCYHDFNTENKIFQSPI